MAAVSGAQPSQETSGSNTDNEVGRLMSTLEVDLREGKLSANERIAVLNELKSLIRGPENASSVFCRKGVNILCQHSFDARFHTSSREASKCLANVLLLDNKTRQMFVDLGYAKKTAMRLRNDNREDELLNSRILFLLTYDTTLDFNEFFMENDLAECINTNLAFHAESCSGSFPTHPPSAIDTMALSETLKLLFNLTQFYPRHTADFSKSIPHILKMVSNKQTHSAPLEPPINYLINSLLNLDLESRSAKDTMLSPFFPDSNHNCHADCLMTILDTSIRQYKEEQLETLVTPLVTLLQKVYVAAPPSVKKNLRASLLPSNEERAQPLGCSDTFASRLLRLSTSPVAPNLRESISSLMFELSDQNPTTFVRNVGYGFASGFLMSHDLSTPDVLLKESIKNPNDNGMEDPGETLTHVDGQEINPITGQRKDMEPIDTGPEMTAAEKEREAERLFVLFERLKATGVVSVVNPVDQALREGRFEELDEEKG